MSTTPYTGSLYSPDRRRRDLRGRVARATYPVRHAVGEFMQALPCRFVGHRWIEASRSMQRERGRTKMRFKCSRCQLRAGFSN